MFATKTFTSPKLPRVTYRRSFGRATWALACAAPILSVLMTVGWAQTAPTAPHRDGMYAQANNVSPNSVVTPDVAHDALAPIGDDAPAPKSKPTATNPPESRGPAQPVQKPSVTQMLTAGEACFARKDYSCSITNATNVLQVQPGNPAATRLKSRSEAAQADALSNIKIE